MTRRGFLLAIVGGIAGAVAVLVPERLVAKPVPTDDAAYLASLRRVLKVRIKPV